MTEWKVPWMDQVSPHAGWDGVDLRSFVMHGEFPAFEVVVYKNTELLGFPVRLAAAEYVHSGQDMQAAFSKAEKALLGWLADPQHLQSQIVTLVTEEISTALGQTGIMVALPAQLKLPAEVRNPVWEFSRAWVSAFKGLNDAPSLF